MVLIRNPESYSSVSFEEVTVDYDDDNDEIQYEEVVNAGFLSTFTSRLDSSLQVPVDDNFGDSEGEEDLETVLRTVAESEKQQTAVQLVS